MEEPPWPWEDTDLLNAGLPETVEELLARPDWPLLLPVQVYKDAEVNLAILYCELAVQRISGNSPEVCPTCGGRAMSYRDNSDKSIIKMECLTEQCEDEDISISDSQDARVFREMLDMISTQPLHTASELSINAYPNERSETAEENAVSDVIRPILHQLANGSNAIQLDRSALDGGPTAVVHYLENTSAIPFLLSNPLRWNAGDMCSLRNLHITGGRETTVISPSSLAEVVKTQATLQSLKIVSCDIWSGRKQKKKLVELAHAFRFSNIRRLHLGPGPSRAPEKVLNGMEVFLENLDSLSLRSLTLALWDQPDGALDRRRFAIAVSRLLRRSVAMDSYRHPAARLDAERYGAPNLQIMEPWTVWDEQSRRIVMTTALVGSRTSGAPEHHAPGSRLSPSPLRDLILDEPDMEVFEPSDDEFLGELTPAQAFAIFDPAPAATMALPPQVLEEAWAEATHYANTVNGLELAEAETALGSQLEQNEIDLDSIHSAACTVLTAARVLACRVSGPLDRARRSYWLDGLPAELRMLVLHHCDFQRRLSEQQFASVVSFASDARTIGYGLNNELLLFGQRLRDEAIDKHQRKPVLDLLDASPWSWAETLRTTYPTDYGAERCSYVRDEERDSPTYTYLDTAPKAAAAFAAVTDCRRMARVPSHLHEASFGLPPRQSPRDQTDRERTRLEHMLRVDREGNYTSRVW